MCIQLLHPRTCPHTDSGSKCGCGSDSDSDSDSTRHCYTPSRHASGSQLHPLAIPNFSVQTRVSITSGSHICKSKICISTLAYEDRSTSAIGSYSATSRISHASATGRRRQLRRQVRALHCKCMLAAAQTTQHALTVLMPGLRAGHSCKEVLVPLILGKWTTRTRPEGIAALKVPKGSTSKRHEKSLPSYTQNQPSLQKPLLLVSDFDDTLVGGAHAPLARDEDTATLRDILHAARASGRPPVGVGELVAAHGPGRTRLALSDTGVAAAAPCRGCCSTRKLRLAQPVTNALQEQNGRCAPTALATVCPAAGPPSPPPHRHPQPSTRGAPWRCTKRRRAQRPTACRRLTPSSPAWGRESTSLPRSPGVRRPDSF